jgi:hypothetical protein
VHRAEVVLSWVGTIGGKRFSLIVASG